MALAARLLPLPLLSRPLPGRATRLRTLGATEVRLSLAECCCLCRRRCLGSSAVPVPRCTWAWATPALHSRGPRRPLLGRAELLPALASFPAGPSRSYSTEEQPQQRQKTRMIILGFSNPINWVRTRIYAFLIWAYFDKEFSIAEFSEGAKQVGLASLTWSPRACQLSHARVLSSEVLHYDPSYQTMVATQTSIELAVFA